MGSSVLVTGGCGYIGSHASLVLAEAGHEVVVVDNLCNSSRDSLRNVESLVGRPIPLYVVDIRDTAALDMIFSCHRFDAVMHFAGHKAVGESQEIPLDYYHNNMVSTLELLKAMQRHKVNRIIFSSSATVYGHAETVPIPETAPVQVTNPYGRTKLMVEEMLQDLHRAEPEWSIALLRYFNPVGGHESGLLYENPNGIPNNLMPYIARVAKGELPLLRVFGDDYPTPDGTGVRDYIHVMDLAEGHACALDLLLEGSGLHTFNLGTGQGYSVLEMVKAYETVNGVPVPYEVAPRREGDVAICFADPSKAERELGWRARRGVEEMVCML